MNGIKENEGVCVHFHVTKLLSFGLNLGFDRHFFMSLIQVGPNGEVDYMLNTDSY